LHLSLDVVPELLHLFLFALSFVHHHSVLVLDVVSVFSDLEFVDSFFVLDTGFITAFSFIECLLFADVGVLNYSGILVRRNVTAIM
jgi:hypothetical protein